MRLHHAAVAAIPILAFVGCGGPDMGPEYPEAEPAGDRVDDTSDRNDDYLPSDELLDENYGDAEHEPKPEPTAADTTSQPPPETQPEPEPPAAEEPPAPEPIEGVIVARKGKTVIVSTQGELPEVGKKGLLFKWFEQTLFGMTATGWLDIAAVTVKKAAGKKLTLAIDEEHSETVMNGKKVNHFKKKNKVKLELW